MADDHLEYTNLNYRNSLAATLGFLLIVNLYFLFSGSLFALIPIVLQAALLSLVFLRWTEQRILIKFWAALIFVSGIAGLIAACSQVAHNSLVDDATTFQNVSAITVLYNVVCICASIYYYRMLPKSTRVVVDTEDAASDSTHAS